MNARAYWHPKFGGLLQWLRQGLLLLLLLGAAPQLRAGIAIVAATYGGNCGVTQPNATQQLVDACNGKNSCSYSVSYKILGDPVPGCKKDFVVQWRCAAGGTVRSKTVAPEAGFDSPVELACASMAMMVREVAAGASPVPAGAAAVPAAIAATVPAASGPPPSAAAPAANVMVHLVQERHLNLDAVHANLVTAYQGDKAERVTPGYLSNAVNAGATFVTRLPVAPLNARLLPSATAPNPTIGTLKFVELPYEVSGLNKDTQAPVSLHARIAEGTGLMLDQSVGRYIDKVYVFLVSADGSGNRVTLANSIGIRVTAVGASVDPLPVRLATTEEPTVVTIGVVNPTGSQFPVSVSAGSDDAGDRIALTIVRPEVSLATADQSIIGWGIGTTTVYVQAPELARAGGFKVDLSTTGGGLDPGTVPLDAQGQGTTTLRSDRSGGATVSLVGTHFQSSASPVTFRSPLFFLALAAVGGLLGAFLRGRGRSQWPQALGIGMGTAVLAALAYSVGFTGWILRLAHAEHLAASGEVIVFVVGAIAALAGVSVILSGGELKKE